MLINTTSATAVYFWKGFNFMKFEIYSHEKKEVSVEQFIAHQESSIDFLERQKQKEITRHEKAMEKIEEGIQARERKIMAANPLYIRVCGCGKPLFADKGTCIGVNTVAKKLTAWFNCPCGSTSTTTRESVVKYAQDIFKK